MLTALSGFGLALIVAMESCLYWGRRTHSRRWEACGRFLQAGVIVIYGALALAAALHHED